MKVRETKSTATRVLTAGLLALGLFAGLLSQSGSLAAPTEAELDAARERLMELEADFEIVVERYNLVHEDLTSIQARIGVTELEVDRIERRMGVRREAAVGVARELYMGGSNDALEAVLVARDFGDVESRLAYLRTSQAAQAELFEGLAADRSALESKLDQLEEDRAAALAAEQRLTALREDIEGKLAAQRDEIAELNAAIERAERLAAQRAAAAEDEAAAATPLVSAPPRPAPAPNAGAQTAVEAALSQVGKPYQWAAAGPDSYDCSGLTMWAWAQAGVALPHNSGMQYAATPRVDRSDWQPGDLLFFGSPIHHVGMYIGNGQMVEAPYTGAQVRVVSASRSDYVGAGRPGT
ncbi:MAG TPA: NlpC/P60 family protein [Actinomycetota bacterium]|nr:NlpC/P60 family protein [Actinomycetota bacterium]